MSKNTKRAKKPTVLTFREVFRRMEKKNWPPSPKELPAVRAAVARKRQVVDAEAAALRRSYTHRDLCCSQPAFAKRYIMSDRWSARAHALAVQDDRLKAVENSLRQ